MAKPSLTQLNNTLSQVRALYEQGNFAEALGRATRALKRVPLSQQDPRVRQLIVLLLLAQGNAACMQDVYAAARAAYNQALEVGPLPELLWFQGMPHANLAIVEWLDPQTSDAVDLLTKTDTSLQLAHSLFAAEGRHFEASICYLLRGYARLNTGDPRHLRNAESTFVVAAAGLERAGAYRETVAAYLWLSDVHRLIGSNNQRVFFWKVTARKLAQSTSPELTALTERWIGKGDKSTIDPREFLFY
jgi:tetratricopeptide (TPR) repeat protein